MEIFEKVYNVRVYFVHKNVYQNWERWFKNGEWEVKNMEDAYRIAIFHNYFIKQIIMKRKTALERVGSRISS